MSLLTIQIIVAVISILLVPLCMYCCKRVAFAALEEHLQQQRRRREEEPEDNVDDHSEQVMKHVIVKVVKMGELAPCPDIETSNAIAEEPRVEANTETRPKKVHVRRKKNVNLWRKIERDLIIRRKTKKIKEMSDNSKSCAICLEAYKEGDEVAYSRNKECAHYFHLDCISDWLRRRDECPVCRLTFLQHRNGNA